MLFGMAVGELSSESTEFDCELETRREIEGVVSMFDDLPDSLFSMMMMPMMMFMSMRFLAFRIDLLGFVRTKC